MTAHFDHDDRSEILVHIGPHKTGTTGVQQAALRASAAIRSHGRVYLHDEGREQLNTSALEFMRSTEHLVEHERRDDESVKPEETQLLQIVKHAPRGKLIMSSEHFCRLREPQVWALRDALANTAHGGSIKILVTLRPLSKIVPGQWQQLVRARPMPSLEEWVRLVLDNDPNEPYGRDFHQRHAHDLLVERWARIFGRENVTVIVADDRQPEFLYRSFEEVIGVPSETLVMRRIANQSMTYEECELVRATHQAMQQAGMFGEPRSGGSVQGGEWPAPTRGESQRIGWSYERIARDLTTDRSHREGTRLELKGPMLGEIAEWSRQIVDGIRRLQVHTMGDLALLAAPPPAADLVAPIRGEVRVTPRLAAALVVSALKAVGVGMHEAEPRILRKASTSSLVRQLIKRALPGWIRIRVAGRLR